MITWDWQYKLDPYTRGSPFRIFELWVKAVSRVKAEFRLASHWKDERREEKRSIPGSEGIFFLHSFSS